MKCCVYNKKYFKSNRLFSTIDTMGLDIMVLDIMVLDILVLDIMGHNPIIYYSNTKIKMKHNLVNMKSKQTDR